MVGRLGKDGAPLLLAEPLALLFQVLSYLLGVVRHLVQSIFVGLRVYPCRRQIDLLHLRLHFLILDRLLERCAQLLDAIVWRGRTYAIAVEYSGYKVGAELVEGGYLRHAERCEPPWCKRG